MRGCQPTEGLSATQNGWRGQRVSAPYGNRTHVARHIATRLKIISSNRSSPKKKVKMNSHISQT